MTVKIKIGDLLTALSVVIAVILGTVGYIQSKGRSIKEHTVELLALLHVSEQLSEANFK
jgi:hypothetical protein